MMDFKAFKAASVIAAPKMFDLTGTIEKCCTLIEEAADHEAKLIVFPETFIPMYPWWIWMSISSGKKLELYKDLFKNSVDIEGHKFKKILKQAKKHNIHVVIGINEIDQMTLYNSQVFINDQGEIIAKRRKLVPTGEERTVWGRGDGSDLFVCDTNIGKISGLICYENSMSLSRYALYSMGAQIHIANWPGSNFKSQPRDRTNIIDLTSRFIAFEGQMFVIASSSYLGEEELDFYLEIDPSLKDSLTVGGGIAGIVSPFGEYITPPLKDEEGIVYGEINLEQILESKHLLDSVGHYSRGDATKLILNQKNTYPVEYSQNGFKNIESQKMKLED